MKCLSSISLLLSVDLSKASRNKKSGTSKIGGSDDLSNELNTSRVLATAVPNRYHPSKPRRLSRPEEGLLNAKHAAIDQIMIDHATQAAHVGSLQSPHQQEMAESRLSARNNCFIPYPFDSDPTCWWMSNPTYSHFFNCVMNNETNDVETCDYSASLSVFRAP